MVSRGTFYGVAVVMTALLMITSAVAVTFYNGYEHELSVNNGQAAELQHFISRYGAVLESNVLIDFGNGTRHWFNGTQVQPGWNFYTLTLAVTNGRVNATCCAFGSHFVTGIDGVQSSASQDRAWLDWTYNGTARWQLPSAGADELNVFNDSVFAWTYCQYDPTTYAPECPPGTP